MKKTRPKPIYITTRSFKHYNRDAFNRDISTAPWSVIDNFDDVENKLNAFHLLFNPILDNHAPIKRIKIRGRPNPYVTNEICALMKTRGKWRKLARKNNDPLVWSGYKNFKREVRRELRLAEREYVTSEIQNNPNNIGSLLKIIRRCIPKKSLSKKVYTKVVNEFNQFFSSVGEKTAHKVKTLAQECNYVLAQHHSPQGVSPQHNNFPLDRCNNVKVKTSFYPCQLENLRGPTKSLCA